MLTGVLIIIAVIAGFVVLLKQAGGRELSRPQITHPVLTRLKALNIKPGRAEYLLCQRPAFISAGHLMTVRERRFLGWLEENISAKQWRLCPQVRLADIVDISASWRPRSKDWWLLFRLISQWHCDVVITDKEGRIIAAVELDDRSHLAPVRQRRDVLLEEVLSQAGIPLLRDADERILVSRISNFLASIAHGVPQ